MLVTRLRHRVLLIGFLIMVAIGALWNNMQRTAAPGRPGHPVTLGLDLQGGMYLALELDQSARVSPDPERDLGLALAILRKRMDEFGVLEPLVQQVGRERIVVELPGVRDPERAKAIVRRNAFLEFRLVNGAGGFDRAVPSMDRALRQLGMTSAPPAPASGVAAQLLGGDSADTTAPALLGEMLQPTGAMPGEYAVSLAEWVRVDSLLHLAEVRRLWPRGLDLKWSADSARGVRMLYALEADPIVTGANLTDAQARVDPLTNGPEVTFALDHAGGRAFSLATGRHVGDYLAILLDGRVQGRPPVIESRIERQGRIQMNGRSMAEAQDLALTLRAGALPIPLKVVEEGQVGPSLGQDSIDGGLLAGGIGMALVVAIIIGYYAASGALAILALGVYALLSLGAMALMGAALTLPGLAGFVLSLGMAVDANVLIFERIREEQDRGKTPHLAVAEGFRQAMPAIVDSNLTTILTALFLFQFGTGPVRGFAVMLVVGILASMVTAIFVTRTLFQLWLRRRPSDAPLSLGGARLFQSAAIDFLGMKYRAFVLTGLLLVAGLGGLAATGVRTGVDFAGGARHQVRTTVPLDEGAVRAALVQEGVEGVEVQRFGGRDLVIRTPVTAGVAEGDALRNSREEVSRAFGRVADEGQFEIRRSEAVGPKVGQELRSQAATAILLSFVAVLGYLAYRFEWRFGLAAVLATAHDIAGTLAFVVLLGLEVNLVVVAALLTVVGYSLNDTIVIFDRVRECLRRRGATVTGALNQAVNETLPRTVLTGGTSLATLAALALFGGAVVRPFALVMFFGILIGTFSSIFIAPPVLAAVHRRWPLSQERGTPRPLPRAVIPSGARDL